MISIFLSTRVISKAKKVVVDMNTELLLSHSIMVKKTCNLMHSERLHPKDYTFWDMQLRKDAKQRQKKGS